MTARVLMQRVLPFVVSALALAALFAGSDAGAVVATLSWRVAGFMVVGMIGYGAVTLSLEVASVLRIIDGARPEFGAADAARIRCASYLLGTLHYALGVGAMTLLLRRRAGVSISDAASVVLLISSTDILVVLGLAAIGSGVLGMDIPVFGVFALAGAGIVGGHALLRTPRSRGPLDRGRALAICAALRVVPLGRLAQLFALRAVFSCSLIGFSMLAFVGFEVDVDPWHVVVGMMLVAAVSALPIAVAGLGTGQAAFVGVFQGVADDETLLAVSLTLSAGMILLRVGMGLIFARELTREAVAEQRDAALAGAES